MTGEIRELLRLERLGTELDGGAPLPRLHAYLTAELERHGEAAAAYPKPECEADELNALFREILAKAESAGDGDAD